MLYLLYTSGTTAKPKGIMHTTAGYLLGTSYTHEMIFDVKPDDVYWCAADIGWVTGHSYIVYGPLANATTGVLYEGSPDTPGLGPLVADHRGLQGHDPVLRPDRHPRVHEAGRPTTRRGTTCRRCASSARSASRSTPRRGSGTTSTSAAGRTPIVDTWWQTETGQILITPLPGVTTTKPGSRDVPVPGHRGRRRRRRRQQRAARRRRLPRPEAAVAGMLRGIYGDPERYKETYWSRFPGMYFAGDGAKRDEDGYLWLLGRVDDVMNVSGHRHLDDRGRVGAGRPPVGGRGGGRRQERPDHRPGDLRLRHPQDRQRADRRSSPTSCAQHVAKVIGPIAKPKFLLFTPDLPKTRSGKIMRRLLRDIAEGRPLGDTTTLADADGRRDDPGQQLARRRTDVPFDFLKRKKGDRPRRPTDAAPPARQAREPRDPVRRPDRGVADRRAAWTSRAGCRTRSTSARRSTISDVQWAPVDGSAAARRPAPGLKTVDPYDLILVLAGEDTLPPLTDAERTAHKVHKVAYDVALEVPPFRVIGTVYLYPGSEPDRLLDRATEMFVPVVDATAYLGDAADRPEPMDAVLVNRFYLRGVEQIDRRTGETPQRLPGRAAGRDLLAGPQPLDRRVAVDARPGLRRGRRPWGARTGRTATLGAGAAIGVPSSAIRQAHRSPR